MEKYSKLKPSTQIRLASELAKVYKAGATIAEAKRMTPQEYKSLTGSKAKLKTIVAYQRLLPQITKTKERREGSIDIVKKSFEDFGFRGAGLKEIEKGLIKTAGNTFSAISQELRDNYPKMTVKESYKRTRELLALPESEYEKLEQQEREIIERYGFETP
ncbi:MAG: hypothetical protein ACTSQJ_06060 [Promethearchaeota archaeon]